MARYATRRDFLRQAGVGTVAANLAMGLPSRYRSVSAFAPIVAPSQVPWGHKALGGYLGDDQ